MLRPPKIHQHSPFRWELTEPLEETTGSGPTDIDGCGPETHKDRKTLDYHVFTSTWKRFERQFEHEDDIAKGKPEQFEQRWQIEGSLLKFEDRKEHCQGCDGSDY
jgi:hypothetical protein